MRETLYLGEGSEAANIRDSEGCREIELGTDITLGMLGTRCAVCLNVQTSNLNFGHGNATQQLSLPRDSKTLSKINLGID